jgi:hypothetical protein
MMWIPDEHCDAHFSGLFQNPIRIDNSYVTRPLNSFDQYNYMDNERRAKKNEFINHRSENNIYIKSAYVLNHKFSNWAEENTILKKLTPVEEISNRVNQNDVSGMVGLHVRMGGGKGFDKTSWDKPNNWSRKGRKEIYYWRRKSHYGVFMKEMDRLLAEQPELTFFLATDNSVALSALQEKYGSKIFTIQRDVYDRSAAQQKMALVDIFLLSRTKFILGSHWSSFSEIVHRLAGNKIRYSGIHF